MHEHNMIKFFSLYCSVLVYNFVRNAIIPKAISEVNEIMTVTHPLVILPDGNHLVYAVLGHLQLTFM